MKEKLEAENRDSEATMNPEPFPSISYSAENERRIERNRAARRIHQNIWGNWNGYESKKRVIEFGMNEFEAKRWLSGVYK